MPRYVVYRTDSGEIVHIHEKVDFASGESVPVTKEEVLDLVDESLRTTGLEVVEAEIGKRSAEQLLRVDTDTGAVVETPREASGS